MKSVGIYNTKCIVYNSLLLLGTKYATQIRALSTSHRLERFSALSTTAGSTPMKQLNGCPTLITVNFQQIIFIFCLKIII